MYLHEAGRTSLLTREVEVNVAKRIGLPLNEVQNILRIAHTSILLDVPIGKGEGSHFGDLVEDRSVIYAAEVVISTDQKFPYTSGPIVSRSSLASLGTKSFP
jgi:DNA-directed RNA polymerase sigma subunit (sigma70/sigma32)